MPPLARASWIWGPESDAQCHLRRVIHLNATPTNATVLITADNGYELFVNGSHVGTEVGAAFDVWQSVERYDLTSRLAKALRATTREARLAAALALAACGTRDSIPPLVTALNDQDPVVAQAANVALENLTGHAEPSGRAAKWKSWLATNVWPSVETALVQSLCTSSPAKRSTIVALGHIGGDAARAAVIVPELICSVPTDPDRGLFLQNDDYELLVGRLIRRSGRENDVIETCLALLGDPLAKPTQDLKRALSTTHPAWGGHPGPENRAAQILSLTCRDTAAEPRVRAAFDRFRALPEEPISRALGNPTWTPVRHWTLFYLARSLGNLGDPASVETLAGVLTDDMNEARHGRPDPSQPEIHLLQLDYTPCWRAAAAWALGEIGARRARPALLAVVRNLDNATDVRHAAATAMRKTARPSDLGELIKLAADYPEVSVRKVSRAACVQIEGTGREGANLNLRNRGK